jgi:hypothetical protein
VELPNKDKTIDVGLLLKQFGDFFAKYNKFNPDWLQITKYDLLLSFAGYLRDAISDPNLKKTSWANPVVNIEYPINIGSTENGVYYFQLESEESTDLGGFSSDKFKEIQEIIFLGIHTNDTALLKERPDDTEGEMVIPKEEIERLGKLPEDQIQDEINRLYDIEPIEHSMREDIKHPESNEIIRVRTLLRAHINPLIIDLPEDRAYYLICVSLDFGDSQPSDWPEDVQRGFWNELLSQIKAATPEGKFDIPDELKKAFVEEISKPKKARAGSHLEKLKFPNISGQTRALDLLDINKQPNNDLRKIQEKIIEEAKKLNIENIGIDLTAAQNRAMFAIQRLFEMTNYKGNISAKKMDGNNPYLYTGDLPRLGFIIPEYLDAYGLEKRLTSRGKREFSGSERQEALKALDDLAKRKFLFSYEKKTWVKKNGERTEDILALDALIRIDRHWSEKDRESGAYEVEITPNPILVDQIDSYFVLKPADYLEEIKRALGRKSSKFVVQFIEYLLLEVAKRKSASRGKSVMNWEIKNNYKVLAQKLGMDSMIKNRQWGKIRKKLESCYKVAIQLGYLSSYESMIPGATKSLERLILNPEKFGDFDQGAEHETA